MDQNIAFRIGVAAGAAEDLFAAMSASTVEVTRAEAAGEDPAQTPEPTR